MNTPTGYLRPDGSPNLPLLLQLFTRSSCQTPGGLEWLDNVRFCRWPNQHLDGRKHDGEGADTDPTQAADPWNNASDHRAFLVDDVIGEKKDTLAAAFWRSMIQPGAAASEESGYAVALLEWLVFTKMTARLTEEVDLSADYQEHIGWCVLAPRWQRDLGLRRHTVEIQTLLAWAEQAPEGSPWRTLPDKIADPTQEDAAVEFLHGWYEFYVGQKLPEDLRARAPKMKEKTVRQAVRDLRTKQKATVVLPYLCRNELEIIALKPWEEVYVPNELTTETEVMFHVEPVSETELKSRETAQGYDPKFVTEALKHKGNWSSGQLREGTLRGLSGQLVGTRQVGSVPVGPGGEGNVYLIHAVYRAEDEDGVPAVYCTTFHSHVKTGEGPDARTDLYGKHELVESVNGQLPYVGLLRERWSRSVSSSRGVTERTHTHQNLVKSLYDGIIDRGDITRLPPVNVYESPTGVKYRFGPCRQNYVRQGREPKFMDMPTGQGLVDSTATLQVLKQELDNRFGLLSPEVPAPRQQVTQEHAVRRFLVGWTQALKLGLCLYQKHGDDAEFAEVTGAPAGWLDAHRDDPDLLVCALEFDVRELDSELELKRMEAVNKLVLPTDVLSVVNRGALATDMMRAIFGPRRAKRLVRPVAEASQALVDKTHAEVAKMFLGNVPTLLDDKDPTAPALLENTRKIVLSNPVYLLALDDEALMALAGDPARAQQLVQQLAGSGMERQPNPRFSKLLVKWLENLQFIGVTQVENKQIGRMGVKPGEE